MLIVARQIGAEFIATGHYARNEYDSDRGRWLLKRPADRAKDQTYFLFGLTQDQLSHTLFPLGEMQKPAVRDEARKQGLNVLADKPDSQEICFVPGGDYKQFLDAYLAEQGSALPDTSGELVTAEGDVIGRHEGIHNFTIGQRKGLGIATGMPLYVLKIDADSGDVTVGPRSALERTTLTASGVNWVSVDAPATWLHASAQIRHRHRAAAGRVRALDGHRAEFAFDDPQAAVTPGQAVVFYDEDVVVGGGWIE